MNLTAPDLGADAPARREAGPTGSRRAPKRSGRYRSPFGWAAIDVIERSCVDVAYAPENWHPSQIQKGIVGCSNADCHGGVIELGPLLEEMHRCEDARRLYMQMCEGSLVDRGSGKESGRRCPNMLCIQIELLDHR